MSMTLNDPRQPKTWHQADTLLGDRDHMKIANNTWLHRKYGTAGSIFVRLHNTYIIEYHHPMSDLPYHVTLHSGGYRTVTTKQRMNLLTNLRVTQSKYEWFVTEPTRDRHGRMVWFGQPDATDDDLRTMEYGDGDTYLNVP